MSTQKEIGRESREASVIPMYNTFNSSKSTELENPQPFLFMKKMIDELKIEIREMIKDLTKQVLKEILQPENPSKKLTKREQFELDIKKKSEERVLALIKKHSQKNNDKIK